MDSSSTASSPSPTPPQTGNRKLVLVTVGTTSFNPLIASVLKPSTMAALRSYGFTDMVVQYGNGRTAYDEGLKGATKSENGPPIPTAALPLHITGFDFTDQMRFEVAKADLVISHAGTGSILDSLRYQKRVIVVANPALMHNHQKELAEEMERQGYLINASLSDLVSAVESCVQGRFKQLSPQGSAERLAAVINEELDEFDALY